MIQSSSMQALRAAATASVSATREAGLRAAPLLFDGAWSTCYYSSSATANSSPCRSHIIRPRSRGRGSSVITSTLSSRWHGTSAFNQNHHGNVFCDRNGASRQSLHRNYYARNFGASRSERKAPHVVLQVSTTANKNEIKAAFRKLAKQHHPDLKVHQNQNQDEGYSHSDDIMAELITAYETLMNKHSEHFWTDARDSKVALACEMYTIEELRGMQNVFDVRSFRVTFSDTTLDDNNDNATTNTDQSMKKNEGENGNDESFTGDRNIKHLDPTPIVPLKAHPDDSISDLKRHIQSCYAKEWGMDNRRVDRDGLFLGWELIHCSNEDGTNNKCDGNVLSYHLFLSSYGIQEGDILHAVVRRDNL